MCDNHENHEGDGHEHGASSANHAVVARSILDKIGVPDSTADTIALAQVHATLALAQMNSGIGQMIGSIASELNTSNLFNLAHSVESGDPLRSVLLSDLLHHLMPHDAAHPETLLMQHIESLNLAIKNGDDITLSNSHQSSDFLVVDTASDEWLLLESDGNQPMNSVGIYALFGANVNTLNVAFTKKPTAGASR